MRTTLGDHLVALRRPAALAAIAVMAGGVVAVLAPRLGLWTLHARVQALDTVGSQAVTSLPGANASPLVWAAPVLGVVVLALGLLVAVDRPPAMAETVLLVCGTALLLLTLLLALAEPAAEAFADRANAAELLGGDVALPTGVSIEVRVRPAAGLWVLGGAGGLVVAGTIAALRRG